MIEGIGNQRVFLAPIVKRLKRNFRYHRRHGSGAFRQRFEHPDIFLAVAVACDEQKGDARIAHFLRANDLHVVLPGALAPLLRDQRQVSDGESGILLSR